MEASGSGDTVTEPAPNGITRNSTASLYLPVAITDIFITTVDLQSFTFIKQTETSMQMNVNVALRLPNV